MSPRHKKPAPVPTTGSSPTTALLANDPILRTVSRAVFALVLLFAFLLLWRGHNAPGGGFIAGLMTVCALILHRIATGTSALRVDPIRLVPWGLALAFVTGLVPYLLGKPFLKSAFGYITTPLTGEFEWASALLFDFGVYLAVVGASLAIAYALIDVDPQERVEGDQ
ncbi:cation transporter [Deinococcus metallilatus]|uniref:Cation transporter n=1 Tax=Deinococcus metallilatus TaxID=1211322 RepID=A0AAJ5JXJ2_9DEIO|nr:Na(+)/H(+) antiporter subunit B [Deinococcus metallilatus]MBB5296854.1 multicomponent Na+:H+ antiporter subunit B [Deinococcus metallilatus]QBY09587.1 cation transporter [Deinococcus metallilatus]RXJ09191.1 cation transporter [Deinococcus metallilatus]TLK22765.1 cation transporter [Deinococcus metallilatus]GMA13888.1 cation transporter [Deinococcus metallilatus]